MHTSAGKATLKGKVPSKWQIDTISLRLIIAVFDEGSIAKAARREFIAASAISKRLNEIEQIVGTSIIKRHARGVEPTAAGLVLLNHARAMVERWESLYAQLSEFSDGLKGQITVYANTSAIHEFLPDEVNSFLKQHESIDIKIEERLSAEVARAVSDGTADIGICRDLVDFGALEVIPYKTDHLALIVPHHHYLAKRKDIEFEEVVDLPQVGLMCNGTVNRFLEQMAANCKKKLHFRLQVPHFEAARSAIQAGVGVGLLPIECVQKSMKGLGLSAIPLRNTWATQTIVICIKSRQGLSVSSRYLLDHLLNETDSTEPGATNFSLNASAHIHRLW